MSELREKILRAKADLDAVYDTGKKDGIGESEMYFKEIADTVNSDGKEYISPTTPYSEYDDKIKERFSSEYNNGIILGKDIYANENVYPYLTRLRERMRGNPAPTGDFTNLNVDTHVDVVIADFNKTEAAIEAHGVIVPDNDTASFAECIDAVYEAGKNAGGGGTSFWDSYQNNGARVSYTYGFAGEGWNDETFKPKYNIAPTLAAYIFNGSRITNLKQILDNAGVVLDFSNCTSLTYAFQNSNITHIGIIDTVKVANLSYFAPNASFVYIEKLILKSDGSQAFTSVNTFGSCTNLEHIIVEGVIGKAGFDVHWATKLDADSLGSIVNCLSTTTTGLTVTLPTTAQTNYDAIYGEGAWATLIATRPNWTIAYL